MTNTFKLFVGGTTTRSAATDYTSKVIRCNYTKEFCNDQSFNAILEGVNRGVDGSLFALDSNVFFTIYDGVNYWLLMKGYIENVKWSSKNRVEISGKQSKRSSSGGKGHMNQAKGPQLSNEGEITLSGLITDSTWFANAKVWKDDGTSGEGKAVRNK